MLLRMSRIHAYSFVDNTDFFLFVKCDAFMDKQQCIVASCAFFLINARIMISSSIFLPGISLASASPVAAWLRIIAVLMSHGDAQQPAA